MNNLDPQFSEIIENELVQEKLLVAMIRQKLTHQGLTISEEQAIEIEQQVREGNFEHINITLSDEQANTLADKSSPLHIEFTDEDVNRVDTQLQSIISDVYLEYAEIFSTEILQEWLTKIPNFITENVAEKRSFELALNSAWAIPMDTLEALIDISLELGANFNQEFRPEALKEDDYVFEALTRLHARACQIAGEAYVLLKSGFADGAMARWRTLHEVSVTALFIRQEGRDVAERYLSHAHVTAYWEAATYQKHCELLGYDPLADEYMAYLKELSDGACARFDKRFARDYGWVPLEYRNLKKDEVRFVDIEEHVNLERMKPFFMMANSRIHAGSDAIFNSLGNPPFSPDTLIAGPSIFGLVYPAQNVAYSLYLTTMTLLLYKSNFSRITACLAIRKLLEQLFADLVDAEETLEKVSENEAADLSPEQET